MPTRYLTRQQVREVDRKAIEEYGVPGVVLMENASRFAASVAMEMLRGRDSSSLILCGSGNNGGDGFAMARHLQINGVKVQILTTIPLEEYRGDAAINANIVSKMRLPVAPIDAQLIEQWRGGLIVDAIFGTGLSREVDQTFKEWALAVKKSGAPVLSVDVPSGLDCDAGLPLGAAIKADLTATFVAMKIGFENPASREYTGEARVGDIGAPICEIIS